MPINYELAKKQSPKLKAMLSRAIHKPEGKQFSAVRKACIAAIECWNDWGAWPDDWRRWESALYDFTPPGQRWQGGLQLNALVEELRKEREQREAVVNQPSTVDRIRIVLNRFPLGTDESIDGADAVDALLEIKELLNAKV